MPKFSPVEIDAFLSTKAQRPEVTDVPADFFENMEARILAAVSAETRNPATANTEAATPPTKGQRRHRTHIKWSIAAAAAAILVIVCTFTIKYSYNHAHPCKAIDNIYAITDGMTDDEIEDLDELYEADLFLEEL